MNNKIITVVIVIVLIGGGLLLFKNRGVAPTDIDINSNMPVPVNDADEMIVEKDVIETSPTNVKEFSVDAVPFSFSPSTISVNKGDTVKITVKNVNGTHDFKIDEFNVSTRTLNTGETQTITFV